MDVKEVLELSQQLNEAVEIRDILIKLYEEDEAEKKLNADPLPPKVTLSVGNIKPEIVPTNGLPMRHLRFDKLVNILIGMHNDAINDLKRKISEALYPVMQDESR